MFVDPNGFGISAWKIRAVVVLTGNGNGSFVLIGLTFTRMLTISIVDRLLHCVLVVVWSLVYSLFFLFFFLSLSLFLVSLCKCIVLRPMSTRTGVEWRRQLFEHKSVSTRSHNGKQIVVCGRQPLKRFARLVHWFGPSPSSAKTLEKNGHAKLIRFPSAEGLDNSAKFD